MSESNPIELTLGQKFEKERFARVIKESTSIEDLRKIANVLLDGWYTQRAASQWMIREAMNAKATTI